MSRRRASSRGTGKLGRPCRRPSGDAPTRSMASRIAASPRPPTGEEHGLAGGGHGADELGILHVRGRDLVAVDVRLGRELERRGIEGLDQHPEARGLGRLQHASPVLHAELDLVEGTPLGVTPHHQPLRAEHLEQDGVGAHLERGFDHAQGGLGGAFVRLGHLGHHERGLAVAHGPAAEGQGPGASSRRRSHRRHSRAGGGARSASAAARS